MDDAPKKKPERAIKLETSFIQRMRNHAGSLSTRAGSILLDEERREDFELSPDVRDAALSLYMTLQALDVLLKDALKTEVPGEDKDDEKTKWCMLLPEAFMQIIECSRLSIKAQESLERYGVSLILH